MLDNETMRAIGILLARQARKEAQEEGTGANGIIDLGPLLKKWKPGALAAGEVVVYKGCPYRVVQGHDSTAAPEWTPEATPALFAPYHGTDAAHALPWIRPTGTQDMYKAGEYMRYTDGKVYMCVMDTVYSPEEYGQAWEEIG